MKIKFDFDDNLPLNKTLKFHKVTIITKPVFEENGKYYPQVFQINVYMNYKCQNMLEYIFQKELMLTKQMH